MNAIVKHVLHGYIYAIDSQKKTGIEVIKIKEVDHMFITFPIKYKRINVYAWWTQTMDIETNNNY